MPTIDLNNVVIPVEFVQPEGGRVQVQARIVKSYALMFGNPFAIIEALSPPRLVAPGYYLLKLLWMGPEGSIPADYRPEVIWHGTDYFTIERLGHQPPYETLRLAEFCYFLAKEACTEEMAKTIIMTHLERYRNQLTEPVNGDLMGQLEAKIEALEEILEAFQGH